MLPRNCIWSKNISGKRRKGSEVMQGRYYYVLVSVKCQIHVRKTDKRNDRELFWFNTQNREPLNIWLGTL